MTQIDELSAQFDEIEDAYLRERKVDIQQVGERVLKVLIGSAHTLPKKNGDDAAPADVIVVAHDISPADMLQFRDRAFSGFVTDLGGQNSHTAIVARSLDIPAAVGMDNASALIEQDDWLIIDGDAGVVIVDPTPLVLEQYREWQARLLRTRKKLGKLKKTAGRHARRHPDRAAGQYRTARGLRGGDGGRRRRRRPVPLRIPVHGPHEPRPQAAQRGRAVRVLPQGGAGDEGAAGDDPHLDIGADKPLDTAEHTALNPALGLRAIRYCLAEPQIFLVQLRAILRASAFGPVKLLIPMLAHAFEIDQALALIEQAKAQLRDARKKFDAAIPVGAMIEMPAAALALPMFIKRMDFLSIGTNDLIQYTLAIDRVDHEVAHLYDPLHPAVLHLLALIISTGKKAGIPVVAVRRNGRRHQADPAAARHGAARILDASGATAVGQAGNPEQRPRPADAANPQDPAHPRARCDRRSGQPVVGSLSRAAAAGRAMAFDGIRRVGYSYALRRFDISLRAP